MMDRASATMMVRLGAVGIALVAGSAVAGDRQVESKWVAHCMANLADLVPRQRRAVRDYCRCMAGLGDDAEMLTMTQSDLEHSYPPAHRQCYAASRLRPG